VTSFPPSLLKLKRKVVTAVNVVENFQFSFGGFFDSKDVLFSTRSCDNESVREPREGFDSPAYILDGLGDESG
jgi:hypothetical protein